MILDDTDRIACESPANHVYIYPLNPPYILTLPVHEDPLTLSLQYDDDDVTVVVARVFKQNLPDRSPIDIASEGSAFASSWPTTTSTTTTSTPVQKSSDKNSSGIGLGGGGRGGGGVR